MSISILHEATSEGPLGLVWESNERLVSVSLQYEKISIDSIGLIGRDDCRRAGFWQPEWQGRTATG